MPCPIPKLRDKGSELVEDDDVEVWMSQRKELKQAKVADWEACTTDLCCLKSLPVWFGGRLALATQSVHHLQHLFRSMGRVSPANRNRWREGEELVEHA